MATEIEDNESRPEPQPNCLKSCDQTVPIALKLPT